MKLKEYVVLLKKIYEDDDELCVPFVWCKSDVEDVFEVTLKDHEWRAIIQNYEKDIDFNDMSLDVMGKCVKIFYPQKNV